MTFNLAIFMLPRDLQNKEYGKLIVKVVGEYIFQKYILGNSQDADVYTPLKRGEIHKLSSNGNRVVMKSNLDARE